MPQNLIYVCYLLSKKINLSITKGIYGCISMNDGIIFITFFKPLKNGNHPCVLLLDKVLKLKKFK